MKARFPAFIVSALCLVSVAHSATLNFGGNFRSEAGSYNNLALTGGGTKNFIASRALLVPNLVVDDHFSIKSQWSLLSSPNFTPSASQALGVGQGSYVFGDPNSVALFLSRAWLEWTSDIGVFRLGRMPVSWGYGVLYDAGEGVWDDFQTTMDRIEYRLHLGYVVGALAYSKNRKLSVVGENDQEFYTAYLRYDNPEVEVEAGLMFEKQQRSALQSGDLANTNANPYHQPGSNAFPIAQRLPSPLSANVIDIYLKKTSGYFSYGGEISWISGNSVDFSGSLGSPAGLNAFGMLFNVGVNYRKVKSFFEVMYIGGDSELNDNNLTGFTLAHRNRRPGLILGRELLGPYYGNNVALGTPFAYGSDGTFSGVLYFRPGVKVEWSPTLTSAVEVIFARKAADLATADMNLGLEIDVGTEYALYKNFKLGVDVGFLSPGAGLGVASGSAAFAFRSTAALTF
jgi:hypothetical protein